MFLLLDQIDILWPDVTVQYRTVQYSTVQYSTAQHSTVPFIVNLLIVIYLNLALQVPLTLFSKTDSVFLKETPRSVYSTIHALGLVSASTNHGSVMSGTSPRACTVQYTLLCICSESVQNTWSWLIQPFADKPRQKLLSGCIRLRPMEC